MHLSIIATTPGIDGDVCDAWAAIVSGLTIIVLVIYLVFEIVIASRRQGALPPVLKEYDDDDEEDDDEETATEVKISNTYDKAVVKEQLLT